MACSRGAVRANAQQFHELVQVAGYQRRIQRSGRLRTPGLDPVADVWHQAFEVFAQSSATLAEFSGGVRRLLVRPQTVRDQLPVDAV
jgi:hypothetical protein